MRKQITSEKGAAPQGVYSPALVTEGKTVYVSGQGPVTPEGELQLGTFAEQAHLTFQNIQTLLEAAGTSWEHALKVGVFLANLDDFAEMNEVYAQYVTAPFPARTTVGSALLGGIAIEVDCIALVPE
jgi:2-iminobutanoate/2-iminopropanoate deaminase